MRVIMMNNMSGNKLIKEENLRIMEEQIISSNPLLKEMTAGAVKAGELQNNQLRKNRKQQTLPSMFHKVFPKMIFSLWQMPFTVKPGENHTKGRLPLQLSF